MLKRLWRWLKGSFQRLFSNKQTSPLEKQRRVEPPKQLTDAEYESLFLQLLTEVNDGLSRGGAKGFLAANRINEVKLVEWLRGFGQRLLALPTSNDELARRMVRLGELSIGEVSIVAYDIARQLGGRQTNHRDAEEKEEGEAEAWFYQGVEQCKSGDFAGAIAFYDSALKIKPDDHEAWNNRGVALYKLGRFEEAIASYDNALKIKPDFHDAWLNQSWVLIKLGRLEEAIASYDNALKIKPDNPEVCNNRGMALGELGRFEEAIASYDNALKIKPDLYKVCYNRGNALGELGRFEEAIASYDNALKIKPDNPEVWTNRGNHLGNLKLYKEALVSFNHALVINPNFPEVSNAWGGLGSALNNLGRFKEALVSYDNALKIKPDKDEAWIGRGIAAGNITGERTDFFFTFTLLSAAAPNLALKFNNLDLNKRGYDGKLASYEEGLKHCQQDTHPEGWGKLHQAIGNTHYFQGRGNSNARYFWDKAVTSYEKALQILTATDFPELHLEVLRDLIRVQLDLEETAEATELQRQGTDLLRRLLNESNRSDQSKKQLALKFAWLQQLTVDLAVQSEKLV